MLFKLIPQQLVLVFSFEEQERVAVYYGDKILQTQWKAANNESLKLEGVNFDEVWKHIVIQVGEITLESGRTLDEQIEITDLQKKLEKRIVVLERKVYAEKQPKKKLALFNELQTLKRKNQIKTI